MNAVRRAVERGAQRITEALDRLSTCPVCKHAAETADCRCDRDDCACGGGAR